MLSAAWPRLRQDRTFSPCAFPAFCVGQLIRGIRRAVAGGVGRTVGPSEAIALGFTPFILGGIVKPPSPGPPPGAWKLLERR